MRKLLLAVSAATFVFAGSAAFAANLDAGTIKAIHEKVKTTLEDKCKKDFTGSSAEACACLGDKAQSFLEDDALGKCAMDESGSNCITKVVSDATLKALSSDNLKACNATMGTEKKDAPAPVPAADKAAD